MSELIRQHKSLATGGGLMEVPAIENPFRQCEGSRIPRGEMKDGKRKGGMSESPYDSDGDRDY